jgi:IS1 family transposase
VDLGQACREYQDGAIQNLNSTRVQVDEIWSFVGSKAKNVPEGKENEYGDAWTWTAIDADSKLMISWWVGGHEYLDASILLQDLHSRLANRVQLSTDGWPGYPAAVEDEFGAGELDYAQIIKKFGLDPKADQKRYSPAVAPGSRFASSRATRTRRISRPAMSKGPTSRCGWGCAASPA